MSRRLLILLFFTSLSGAHTTHAQHSYDNITAIYFHHIREQAAIYNGLLYNRITNINSGHPYFAADSMLTGSVFYDSLLFPKVPLMLDEVTDELVTEDYGRRNLIQLIKLKVDYFIINGHKFIKRTNAGSEAYYQQLYAGKSILLKKEIKTIEKRIVNQFETVRNINVRSRYFLDIDGRFFEVKNKRTFRKSLGEHRTTVTRRLKDEHLNYRSDRDDYLIRGITHYDNLSK